MHTFFLVFLCSPSLLHPVLSNSYASLCIHLHYYLFKIYLLTYPITLTLAAPTFHTAVRCLQVCREILGTWLHLIPEFGYFELTRAIARAPAVNNVQHGDRTSDVAIVPIHTLSNLHPPVVCFMHDDHLIHSARHIERLELAVFIRF